MPINFRTIAFGAALIASAGLAMAHDSGPKEHPEEFDVGDRKVYVACYFDQGDGDHEWDYALTAQNEYMVLEGGWRDTPVTGVDKFTTEVEVADIAAGCKRVQAAEGITGNYVGGLGATGRIKRKYPIVSKFVQLYPLL